MSHQTHYHIGDDFYKERKTEWRGKEGTGWVMVGKIGGGLRRG